VTKLDDVLVITVKKSFWRSPEAEQFPHRVLARVLYGHSTNLVNSVLAAVRGMFWIVVRRPRVVLLGSVERTVPWFVRLRRLGAIRAKLVVTNQLHLDAAQLSVVDANIVYSRAWIEQQPPELRRRSVFIPLPADGDVEAARRDADSLERGRVFSGGGSGRDFTSLIEAAGGEDLPVEIVTFSRATLGYDGELPPNVHVHWRMTPEEFLARTAASLFVVVPLKRPDSDFGQSALVQALAVGKAVVATRSLGIVDYVDHEREGLLVEAGDVEGLRAAMLRLAGDEEFRKSCEAAAATRARELTYGAFAARLRELCEGLAAAS